MFGKKNKKSIDNSSIEANSYQMNNEFAISNLVIAKIERISSQISAHYPIVETTDQKYIFEIVKRNNMTIYREVFTGLITTDISNIDSKENTISHFDYPYVYEPEKITDYISSIDKIIVSKFDLLWLLNNVNYPKEEYKTLVK